MNRSTRIALLALGLFGVAEPVLAQQYVYPSKGQSPAKQQKDEAACSSWARSQSGYDPANPPVAAKAQPAPVTGSGSRAKGAAAGAIIGGVSGGDAGSGALAGAAVGGLTRRFRNAREAENQNEANAQYASEQRASYERARTACLTGRGYGVK